MRWTSLVAIAAAFSTPAWAQETASPTGDTPPPAAAEVAASASNAARQVYAPADFARYAPKNAYDMLIQVPSFQIRDNENLRGLGQATGNVLFNGERPSNKADDMYTQLSRIPAGNVERIEIVDGAYVRGLAAAGYRKLSANEVVSMKAMGVTADYAQAMNRAAGGNGK